MPDMKTAADKPPKKRETFFSLALRHLLHRTGRKQADVGSALGYGSSYMSQISNGKQGAKIEDWSRIAGYFGLTIEQFVHLARLLNEGKLPDVAYNTATNSRPSTEIDRILGVIREYWLDEKGESAESMLALSGRFPEITEWAERRIIIKNPAECRA